MRRVVLDFSDQGPPDLITCERRIVARHVTLSRGDFQPGAIQLETGMAVIAVHLGPSSELTWQRRDEGRQQMVSVMPYCVHYINPGQSVMLRWPDQHRILAMGLHRSFFDRVVQEAFHLKEAGLAPAFGIRDEAVAQMALLWNRELEEGGAGGRLYLEGLATAALVHIVRHYSPIGRYVGATGGLGAARLRRVLAYIDARLADDVSLADLAAIAGLSLHHFGEAFKATTGISPHRFLIYRRIEKARLLLSETNMTVAEIAYAVGFSSQSHLTVHFQRQVGTTPARFRRDNR